LASLAQWPGFDFAGPQKGPQPQPVRVGRSDDLYQAARGLIDQGRFEKAIEQLTRVANARSATRVDAALYWLAYSQSKLSQSADALATLADLQKRFADSRWLKDAQALELQIRQSSGQAVSPDSQPDEELKLLALRG